MRLYTWRAASCAAAFLLCCVSLQAAAQGGVPSDTVYRLPDSSEVMLDTVPLVAETTVTLVNAIAGALQTSPVTAQAQAGVRIALSTERVAWGEFLPNADVSGSWYRSGQPEFGNSASGVSLGGIGASGDAVSHTLTTPVLGSASAATAPSAFSSPLLLPQTVAAGPTSATTPYSNGYVTAAVGWDVFTAGRRVADNAWARALAQSARSTELSARYLLIGAVKTTFYNVLRDEDLEAVARAQLRRASEDLRVAQHCRAVGAATPADVLQFELNLNTARQALLQAITNRRTDAYGLGRLAGVEGAAEADRNGAPLAPAPLALSDTAIVALAVTAAPTLVALLDSERAANAAMWAARTQYLPTIRVGAGYTAVQTYVPTSTIQPGWELQVGTVFPLFNGFVREDAMERAAAARMVARISARDAERNARAQAEALVGTVHLSDEQIRLAQVSLNSAQENYRVEQARYSVGAATVLDLAVAEESLAQAEQQLVNARYDYQLARANLETLIGQNL